MEVLEEKYTYKFTFNNGYFSITILEINKKQNYNNNPSRKVIGKAIHERWNRYFISFIDSKNYYNINKGFIKRSINKSKKKITIR